MKNTDVRFEVRSGPHTGDTIKLEAGYCRLVGRHLSAAETALMESIGKRILEQTTRNILNTHLPERTATKAAAGEDSQGAFVRGPDVVLADDAVSRAHAMIFCDADEVGVIDLGSTNGTLVNGTAVTTCVLHHHDELVFGCSTFRVHIHKQD